MLPVLYEAVEVSQLCLHAPIHVGGKMCIRDRPRGDQTSTYKIFKQSKLHTGPNYTDFPYTNKKKYIFYFALKLLNHQRS